MRLSSAVVRGHHHTMPAKQFATLNGFGEDVQMCDMLVTPPRFNKHPIHSFLQVLYKDVEQHGTRVQLNGHLYCHLNGPLVLAEMTTMSCNLVLDFPSYGNKLQLFTCKGENKDLDLVSPYLSLSLPLMTGLLERN